MKKNCLLIMYILCQTYQNLFLHIRTPNHALSSSFKDGFHIIFPTFCTKAILGIDDVYLAGIPANLEPNNPTSTNIYLPTQSHLVIKVDCRPVTQIDTTASIASKKEDNLLCNLRQYYDDVKTKRRLNMNVPVGFQHNTSFQRQVRDFYLENTSPPEPAMLDTDFIVPETSSETSIQL